MRLDRPGVTAPGGATEPAADTTRGRSGPAATGRRSARGTFLLLASVIIAFVVAVVIALT
jgi:hypothetical protein